MINTMTRQIDYFAYGSNMHLLRLRQRVPSCKMLGVGQLRAHLLRFHKRSPDGSGKCNIVCTGSDNETIFGVLYGIDSDEKYLLDEAEGIGHGYEVDNIDVEVDGNNRQAYTYVADPNYLDDALLPYDWYKELVIAGAMMHALPNRYVATIARHKAIKDPDAARAKEHREIILQGSV